MLKRLPCSIIAVVGHTGVGKTSLCDAMAIKDYKKYCKERYFESLTVVQMLAKNGYKNLKLDKKNPLYFSNNVFLLNKKKNISTWDIDITRLGVPNSQYAVQNLPYGAVVVASEADIAANCNDNRGGINEFIRALLKYHRHNNLTIILDLQDFSRLAKDFRNLVTYIYFVRGKKSYNFFGHVFLTRWKFFKIDFSLLNMFDNLGFLKIPVKEKNYFSCETFNFWGNIYKRYDSQSGLSYFLSQIDHYDYIKPVAFNGSRESVNEYVLHHPIVPPDDFKKGVNTLDLSLLDDNTKKYVNRLTKQFKDSVYDYLRKGGENNE